jgi:hypothetical protein
MENITLYSTQNTPYSVALPEPTRGQKSAYLFAYAKSGSTLMDNMISHYCAQTGMAFFSLFGQAFSQGIQTSDIDKDAAACFKPEGYIYSGFRHYPKFRISIGDEPVVLLVRDPRDMLVSLYYSIIKSHVIPEGNMQLKEQRQRAAQQSIDEFVVQRAGGYLRQFERYKQTLGELKVKVYRYEDVIYDKKRWLWDMIQFIGLPEQKTLIEDIASRFDIVPDSEHEMQHIRQVHPGNHRDKLQKGTISRLNQKLAPFLSAYDYSSSDGICN